MTSSSSSKPNTPTTSRRNLSTLYNDESGVVGGVVGDGEETQSSSLSSRIPLPSPGSFRRSVSLRLRNSQNFLNTSSSPSYYNKGDGLKTGVVTTFVKDISQSGRQHSSCSVSTGGLSSKRQRDLNSSRSLNLITADLNCVNLEDSLNVGDPPRTDYTIKQLECGRKTDDVAVAAPSVITTGKLESHGMSLSLNGPAVAVASTSNQSATGKLIRTPQTPNQFSPNPVTKVTPKTPPVTPDSPYRYLDDDLDSLYSYSSMTSGRSTMSCEHPYVARNGTTFSGRKMKYVVHCSSYAGQVGEDYLTPTQRAQRQLRRLKELLSHARQDLEQKDSEIVRLTREVVELRLFKASLSSPEDRSNSSDAVTVREAATDLKTSQDVSPIVDMMDEGIKSSPRHHALHHHGIHQVQFMDKISNSEMQSSFADSGHFEDLTTSSIHSKDSFVQTHDRACGSDVTSSSGSSTEEQRQELIQMYENRIDELIREQDAEKSEMKQSHNDKVEALLQKLAECNTRYADIVPDYEQAKERIRELERQLEDLQRRLHEQEVKHNKMYLHMYTKGQEAEKLAHADQVLEFAHRAPSRVSVPELLQQLQNTQDELENIRASNCRSESGSSLLTAKEAISLWVLGARKTIYRRLMEAQQNKQQVDPEVTLQFLKSAIYYFLTDKENSHGHLNAIESILEFSEQEKLNISKARQGK